MTSGITWDGACYVPAARWCLLSLLRGRWLLLSPPVSAPPAWPQCSSGRRRIHLMAGRVPLGADRAAVAGEMEATFIENLRYAADLLAQEDMIGLVEPINSRITDPRYFLNTPHQAAAILEKVGRPNLKLQLDLFHCQIMDGNLSRNLETYFPLIGNAQHPDLLHGGRGAGAAFRRGRTAPRSAVAGWGCGAAPGSPCLVPGEGCRQGCCGQGFSHSLPRSHPDCPSARAARARQPRGVKLPLHLRAPGVSGLHRLRGVRVCSKRRHSGRSGLAALVLGEPRPAPGWEH
ncbi:putative hydroxypyruvate isomerase isoform X1 [Opisthocomus hoazin]|uniref:putative hydroxypyruvate isomerase isoform X1 n=1 Tax=Opisthocomus hoazin TaxID=30419 RepID=UPI003F52E8F2